MKASEIMMRDVVAVAPDTPVRDVAKLMVDQRISGVPVIDHGRLVGIISENDLVRRVEFGTEKTRSRWVQFLTSDDTLLAEYVHARGQVARDVMTTHVVTRPIRLRPLSKSSKPVTSNACPSSTAAKWSAS